MNVKKLAGGGVILALLLTGCGEQKASETAQAPASPAAAAGQTQADPAQAGQAPQGGFSQMNSAQMEMMIAFGALMRMDQADGLAITKQQADVMLPMVEKAVADGEWSSELTTKLHEPLTEKQAAYLRENAMTPGAGRNGQAGQGQGRQGGQGQGAGGQGQGQGRQGGQGGQGGQWQGQAQRPAGNSADPNSSQAPNAQAEPNSSSAPKAQANPSSSQAPSGQAPNGQSADGQPPRGGNRMNGGGMNAANIAEQFVKLLKEKQ